MGTDMIRGKTLRWTFEDGPTQGKTFEHTFSSDGTLRYRMIDAKADDAAPADAKPGIKYELAEINDDVYAVSYLSPQSGYTLTSVLDLKTGTVTAFASNEKQLVVQHGHLDGGKRAQ
jgi:hypothetical protein